MMKKTEFRDLIPFYIAQTLTADQKQAFEAYLDQCGDECQHEIDEWRMIASVVWREADDAARKLPPLSPEVYNRLTYQNKVQPPPTVINTHMMPPKPSYATRPTPPMRSQPPRRSKHRRTLQYSIPLTMVAGLVISFLFGGLIVYMALNSQPTAEIALTTNGIVGDSGQFGNVSNPTRTPLDVADASYGFATNTPQPTNLPLLTIPSATMPYQAVLPPTVTTRIPVQPMATTASQNPSVGMGGGSGGDMGVASVQQQIPQTQIDRGFIAQASAQPRTGDASDSGSNDMRCIIVNTSGGIVNIYAQASRNAAIVGTMQPAASYRTIVISRQGWYQVVDINAFGVGWISPQQVTLQEPCPELWTATPTPAARPESGTMRSFFTQASVIIVTAPFADVRLGPSPAYDVLLTIREGEQYQAIARLTNDAQEWIEIVVQDDRTAWVWAQSVTVIAEQDLQQPSPPNENPETGGLPIPTPN